MVKKGFTLAEVLITLAIIGVVAALTIPTVVRNYQKQQTVVQLKKAYTQILQVINMSEAENGAISTWDYSDSNNSEDFYNNYLAKYLKVSKYLGTASMITYGVRYYVLNGDDYSNVGGWWPTFTGPKLILNDGTILMLRTTGNYASIAVDINGAKKPNMAGKDLFFYDISPLNKQKLIPHGMIEGQWAYFASDLTYENRNKITKNGNGTCRKDRTGYLCSALIMLDGWEIKDDYPW